MTLEQKLAQRTALIREKTASITEMLSQVERVAQSGVASTVDGIPAVEIFNSYFELMAAQLLLARSQATSMVHELQEYGDVAHRGR
jgi:uncharacterized protein (DUF2164 family)